MKFSLSQESFQGGVSTTSTKPLSDVEFVARLAAIDGVLEDNLSAFDAKDDKIEVAESFKVLNAQITAGILDGKALEAFALSTDGLKEMFTDISTFKVKIAEKAKSVEGFLDGVLGDTNAGIIGAIIAFARNNLPSVKEQIDICKQKLANTRAEDVTKRSNQAWIRVRSKYLPSVTVFNGAVKALNTALAAVAANPAAAGDTYSAKLKGSMYEPRKGEKQGYQKTDWKYIGYRVLPTVANMFVPGAGAVRIAERFYYDRSQPVGERGWNKKEIYAAGLKQIEDLVGNLAKALGAVTKAKDPNKVVDAAQFCKWAEKEVVYLGRGLTTAIRKVYAGGFVRLVSNRFIH